MAPHGVMHSLKTLFAQRALTEDTLAVARQTIRDEARGSTAWKVAHETEASCATELRTLDEAVRRALSGSGTGTGDAQLRSALLSSARTAAVDYRLDSRALSRLTSAAGGATAARDFAGMVGGALVDAAPLLGLATLFPTPNGDQLDVPFVSVNPTPPGIIAEAAALTAVEPTFGLVNLVSFKYPVLTKVSRELVEDSAFDVESYMANTVAARIAALVSADYYRGAGGATAPAGLATALSTVTAGSPTAAAFADIESLIGAVPAAYRTAPGMSLVMSPGAYMQLRSQKGSTGGSYLWPVTDGNVLFGFPVFVDNALPSAASTNRTVIAGNIGAAYAIRMVDLRVEKATALDLNSDLVNVRCIVRTDGRTIVTDACRALVH